MAATLSIYEWNGAGPTGTSSAGGVRFRNNDTAVVDTTDPLVKAAAGATVRSYRKSLRLYCGAKNTSTSVSNVRFYTANNNWGTSYITLMVRTTATTTYSRASAAETVDTGFADAANYNSGSPLTLGAGPYTLTDAAVVAHPYVELFVRATTSGDGTQPAIGTVAAGSTLTLLWDEV